MTEPTSKSGRLVQSLCEQAAALCQWLGTWWYPPNIDELSNDDKHSQTYEWAVNYSPKGSANEEAYSSALEYAERQYDQAVNLVETLDKKLDDLMRNAGALGTILAAAAKLFSDAIPFTRSPLMIFSIVFLIATVILSARTRGPALMAVPMSTRALLEVIDLDAQPTKFQVEAATAASYHYAEVGMNRVNLWKSTQLKRATVLFCLGLLFLMAMFIFPSTGPESPRNSPSSSTPRYSQNP